MNYPKRFLSRYIEISDEAYAAIKECFSRVIIPKGEIIIRENEYHPYVYLIREGVVRAFVTNNGVERTTSFWIDDEVFGDISCYICNKPALRSFEAGEIIIAYKVDTMAFRSLFEKNNEICNIGRLLMEDFIMRNHCLKDSFANMNAKEKYECFIEKRKGLIERVRLKDVASFLNTTPETLSRIRREYKKV